MTFEIKTKSSFCAFSIKSNEPNGDDVTSFHTKIFHFWTMEINVGQLISNCPTDLISFWINSHLKVPKLGAYASSSVGEENNDEDDAKVHYRMFCLIIHDIFVG